MATVLDLNWAEQARYAAEEGFLHRFLRVVAARPEACALIDVEAGREWSYAELAAQAGRIRGALRQLGVGEGDRVLIMMSNSPELLASLLAVVSLSAMAVMVSPGATPFELEPMLGDARPRAYLCQDNLSSVAAERLLALCPSGGVCVRGLLAAVPSLAALQAEPSALTAPAGNPEITCHFTYKGVGYPLGVVHRYHDYSASIAGCAELMPIQPGVRHLVALPMYAVFSMVVAVLFPLAHGGTLVLANAGRKPLLPVLEQQRVQVACLVRDLLAPLLRAVRRQGGAKLHPHFILVGGGSYIEPALMDEVREVLKVDLFQGYGATETLPVISNSPYHHKPASLGLPTMPGVQVAILDHAGNNLPPGEVGEICVAGSTVARRYLDRPEESAQFFRKGWFHSGDLGYRDWRGYVHFVNRRMAFTKIHAQMVDLLEVQRALETHPRVARARVHARERDGVQVLEAAVMPHPGQPLPDKELRRFLAGLLSAHKVPKRIRVIHEGATA